MLAKAGNTQVPVKVTEHKSIGNGNEEPHIVTVTNSKRKRVAPAARSNAAGAIAGGPAGGGDGSGALSMPSCLQGGMQGGDIHEANMTITAAAGWCTKDPKCGGFVATGQYPTSCSAATTVYDMHFKDTWGAAHRDADPMLTSWTVGSPPNPPSPPTPPAPSNVPLITAFATVNGTDAGHDASASTSTGPETSASPLATLRLYLGFWSVVANGIAPPANRTVSVSVASTMSRTELETASSAGPTATLWRIDASHANPLAAWQAMGSPAVPSKKQLASLIATSVVHPEAVPINLAWDAKGGVGDESVQVVVSLSVVMAPNAAVMVTF